MRIQKPKFVIFQRETRIRVKPVLACLFALLTVLLYFSPSMRTLRAMPLVSDSVAWSDSSIISANVGGTAQVARQGDQRLFSITGEDSITFSLFNLLPLKTVTVASTQTELLAGGETVGIVLYMDGVQIIGLGSVSTKGGQICPASLAGLQTGDTVTAIDGVKVQNAQHFAQLCNKNEKSPFVFSYERSGRSYQTTVSPVFDEQENTWRIGAWVRDSTSGVGTLSFCDAEGVRFCALGHAVTDVDTGVLLPSKNGILSQATVTEIVKGRSGSPGELIGNFGKRDSDAIGRVLLNSEFGIYGRMDGKYGNTNACYPLARAAQAQLGNACILSAAVDGTVQEYSCSVVRADVQSAPTVQGMIVEVTDARLLAATGGIVQGMSGSPVIQNGKIIAVVTHVFVNNPKRGYCVYAEWMYQKMLSMG